MLSISAENSTGKAVEGVKSYCVPHHYSSKANPLAIAKKAARFCNNLTYTQVCRGNKAIREARKSMAAAAKIKEIKTILAVTGDNASKSDINVTDLINAIDNKRFSTAAAIVFTRADEARRIAQKAESGAAMFYTQPVFPGNSQKLFSVIRQLQRNLKCSIIIGVLIPFSSAACQKIALSKPDFISETSFIPELAKAEQISPLAAYNITLKLAKKAIAASFNLANLVNSVNTGCKVTGIHLYGLGDRTFGEGGKAVKVTANELFEDIFNG